MSEKAIVAKVWNFATILRDSGVSYTEYVAQLSYLLFLKMESERESIGESSKIPTSCKWERLIRLDGLELESAYNAALAQLAKSEGVIGLIYNDAQNKIKEPANLKKLFVLMDSETWLGLNVDVKGAIYEGLLAKNATETKAGAGQYFTPRVLIDSIVGLMELKPNMEVCDPACGTGGFLLSAYEAMKAQTKDKEELKRLRNERLCGKDITPLVASLCAMNLYLHVSLGPTRDKVKITDSKAAFNELKQYIDEEKEFYGISNENIKLSYKNFKGYMKMFYYGTRYGSDYDFKVERIVKKYCKECK